MLDQQLCIQILLGSAGYPGYFFCLPPLPLQMPPQYGSGDFADLSIWTLGQLLALLNHFQPRPALRFALNNLVAGLPTLPIL